MILLIDNYDSFSYNLYQLIGSINPDILVIRNDECTIAEIRNLSPDAIILSPGPGRPEEAGICVELIQRLSGAFPMFGVCLGHQAICEAYGATVSYAKELMHGKSSSIALDTDCPIFKGMNPTIQGARYHSLAAIESSLPEELIISARSEDGEVMAVQHKALPLYGVQFHPESILTPEGRKIIENFLEVIQHDRTSHS